MEGLCDSAYCISVKGDAEGENRWLSFKKQIPAAWHVKRFNAIDCRGQLWKRHSIHLTAQAHKELQSIANEGFRQRHEQLTPGALGCYLSHLNILRQAYAQNLQSILVFEDDALLPVDLLPRLAEQVAALPKDWDMLVLGYSTDIEVDSAPLRLRRFYRLHAYLISQKGMAKVLALGFPIRKQLDSALSDWSERIAIYGAVPQLVPNDDSFQTTIQLPLKHERKSLLPFAKRTK